MATPLGVCTFVFVMESARIWLGFELGFGLESGVWVQLSAWPIRWWGLKLKLGLGEEDVEREGETERCCEGDTDDCMLIVDVGVGGQVRNN